MANARAALAILRNGRPTPACVSDLLGGVQGLYSVCTVNTPFFDSVFAADSKSFDKCSARRILRTK
eukprot:5588090-Amphidinium_carterae.2